MPGADHLGRHIDHCRSDILFQLLSQTRGISVHMLGSTGDQTVLASGLNPSMLLVTTGAYQLDDGTAVRMEGIRSRPAYYGQPQASNSHPAALAIKLANPNSKIIKLNLHFADSHEEP
jgi:hypothetical protein